MKVIDLFSRRQALERGESLDILSYEKLPKELRVQIIHILKDYLGNETDVYSSGYSEVYSAYKLITETLCREYGLFHLPGTTHYQNRDYLNELWNFILKEEHIDKVLDAVELCCRYIDKSTRSFNHRRDRNFNASADAALNEINARFQRLAIGYRYENSRIIRVDSELVHAELIKPALLLLHSADYKGAEVEFLSAFEHYRHERYKEALTDCLKSLESTLKAIAIKRNWPFSATATAKPLLDLMFENELIPKFWSQHFSGLRSTLESGVPTARNRLGGHGQGTEVISVPGHLVAFALHQTAAAIVFLSKAEASSRPQP